MLQKFDIIDLGLIDYDKAFLFQEALVLKRQKNEIIDTVIFCKHSEVVTLGRASVKEDLQGWTGQVFNANRGGRATYHGPGQIVIYPIISLKDNKNSTLRSQDVRQYLEALETVVIKTLEAFNLQATAESSAPLESGQLNRGIWVGEKKIASIGIAVKKWVTMHGVALNILKDQNAFTGIKACGFDTKTYTSLEEQGVQTSYDFCKDELVKSFGANR